MFQNGIITCPIAIAYGTYYKIAYVISVCVCDCVCLYVRALTVAIFNRFWLEAAAE